MPSCLDEIFKDIALLLKINVPFAKDSVEYNSVTTVASSVSQIPEYQAIVNNVPSVITLDNVPWFVWLSTLCSRLVEATECLGEVISVTHLGLLRASLSKLMAFAVVPNLSCQLPYPSTYLSSSLQLTQHQRMTVVDLVTRIMLVLLNNDHTRNSVMKHYGELLGAMLSLNVSKVGNTEMDLKSKAHFKEVITTLLDDLHQPTVFTHLMILHSTRGDGGKVSRVVRKVLDRKLQNEGGVYALLGATVLSDENPSSTQDIVKICNLFVGKHPDTFYQSIYPQVLELLKDSDKRAHQVAASCISLLYESDIELCERYMISPLLSPLETPCKDGDIESVLISLKRLIDASPPGFHLSRPLPLISLLYASIEQTPTALKSTVSELLVACLNRLSLPCPYLLKMIFPLHPGVIYCLTPSCSVVSVKSDGPIPYESYSEIILNFIFDKKLDKITVELFRCLLEYIIDSKTPLEHKLVSTQVLTTLSSHQSVVDSLSKEPRHLIQFLSDLFTKAFDSESVSLGLILLTVFLNENNLLHKKSNWAMIGELEKPLLKLQSSKELEVKMLSSEILKRLSDMGIIKSEKTFVSRSEDVSCSGAVKCDYDEAYKESMDPHLPVRAHALRSFSKLLQAQDKTTLNNKTTVLAIFKSNLDDSDSYLYLSAIEGLSRLASVFPDDIITTLCQEFLCRQGKPELRLKIGQVIVKTTNLMGEMGAVYKNEVLGALLVGAADPDPLVRASSLSNIGEIAKVLSFRIHHHLVEIFHCVERIVDTDKEMEPRRAAVMLISLLLQGLGKDTFTVLEEVILELYRKLKVIYQTDRDEVTRLHAQVALEHLSHSTRSLLFTQPSLTKHITVLDINK